MGIKVDTSEMTTLCSRLKTGGARVGAQSSRTLRKTAHAIQADAQSLAPVDTGNLRSSILTTFEGDGRHSSMTALVTANADYSGYVEHGTSTAVGQPFMRPAFDRQLPGLEAALLALGGSILE